MTPIYDAGEQFAETYRSVRARASAVALVGAANRTHTAEVEWDDWRAKTVAIIGYRDTLRWIVDYFVRDDGGWRGCGVCDDEAWGDDPLTHEDDCIILAVLAALGPATTTHREEHDDLETP